MVWSALGGRVVGDRITGYLVAGDLVALVLFAALGSARHAGTLASSAETAGQFGVGWFIVAVLAGAYGPRSLDGIGRAVLLGAGGWTIAAVVGAGVRAWTEPGAGISPVFLLVTAGVGAVMFGGWRGIAAILLGDRASDQ